MKDAQKEQGRALGPKDAWPEEFTGALAEQDGLGATSRPSRKDQIVVGIKLFVLAGAVMLALWLMDHILTR